MIMVMKVQLVANDNYSYYDVIQTTKPRRREGLDTLLHVRRGSIPS
jgi:hypothetical protein